jgi:hypothetical protein
MLVIGVDGGKAVVYKDLDVDPDIDAPRKIHDKLKEEAKHNQDFDLVICVEDEEVKATLASGEDYDLSEDPADEDTDTDDDDLDDDKLNDDGDDFNDDDDIE